VISRKRARSTRRRVRTSVPTISLKDSARLTAAVAVAVANHHGRAAVMVL
jgi:hypothetical protein